MIEGFTSAGSNKPCRFGKGDKQNQAKVDPPYSKIRDPMEALSILTAQTDPQHPLHKSALIGKLMAQAGRFIGCI